MVSETRVILALLALSHVVQLTSAVKLFQKVDRGPQTDAEVEEIDAEDFTDIVIRTRRSYFVFFHHSRCAHCSALFPEFERAYIDGGNKFANFAIVDCTAEEQFQKQQGIVSFPELRFYGDLRKEAEHVKRLPGWRSNTERKSLQLVEWLQMTVKELYPEEVQAAQKAPTVELYHESQQTGFEDDDEDDLAPSAKVPLKKLVIEKAEL